MLKNIKDIQQKATERKQKLDLSQRMARDKQRSIEYKNAMLAKL